MKIKKPEQVEAFQMKILNTAEEIIKEEGIQGLSIRKLTQRLEYTPGIIYHYFKNKDEILSAITMRGYQEIMQMIRTSSTAENPKIRLRETLSAYIHGMCERKELFMILMLSEDPVITSQIDLLKEGIRHERASIQALCMVIEEGITAGVFACDDVELRAQVLWCATFGLIQRLCKEKISDEQKEKLIQEHLHMLLNSLEASS